MERHIRTCSVDGDEVAKFWGPDGLLGIRQVMNPWHSHENLGVDFGISGASIDFEHIVRLYHGHGFIWGAWIRKSPLNTPMDESIC